MSVSDRWSALSHKAPLADRWRPTARGAQLAPTWVSALDETHVRRLNAYCVLDAYLKNTARQHVAGNEEEREKRREYGDPKLLVTQVAAAIVGRGARIGVVGAEDRPAELDPEHATETDQAEHAKQVAIHDQAKRRQAEIDEWADAEQWPLRVVKAENDCVGLGDTVWWLVWSSAKRRVRARVLHPSFYFPVLLPGDGGEDYPPKVHLAWEYEARPPGGDVERWVRRITYELVPIPARHVGYQAAAVAHTCLLTDAEWRLDGPVSDIDFTRRTARIRTNEDGELLDQLDLGIDFIPVVHMANTADGDPFGDSLLTNVAHVLDDLQIGDTDAAEAADIAGGPPIAVAGYAGQLEHYGPRTVWTLPTGGAATVLDTSQGLASLHEHVDRLWRRLSSNSRVPEEVVGRVSASQVTSGVALSLSFGPFEAMIEQARMARTHKYRLILKMVQRLHIAAGAWSGAPLPALVTFGAALPSDLHGLAAMLQQLTGNRALISRSTALRTLSDAGLNTGPLADELGRVQAEDFEGANTLYRATRDPGASAEYLRRDLTEFAGAVMDREKQDHDLAAADAASERMNADTLANGNQSQFQPPGQPGVDGGTGTPPANGDGKKSRK